jgi:hypothetical protein
MTQSVKTLCKIFQIIVFLKMTLFGKEFNNNSNLAMW